MKRRFVIVLVFLMLAGGIALVISAFDEPSYQGKPLSGGTELSPRSVCG